MEYLSNHGNPAMYYNGYEYLKRNTGMCYTLWRCRIKTCTASIRVTNGTKRIFNRNVHNHPPPNKAKIYARILRLKAKKLVEEVGLTPRDAMNSVLTGANEEVLAEVPAMDTFTRTLNNYKRHQALNVKDFPEKHNAEIILYDSGLENDRRLIITGEKKMIPTIEKELTLYFDSSLPPKVRPGYHMYRVHAKIGDPPCLFVLFTHKDQDSILLMFKAIKEIAPNLRPAKILTDVEHYTLSAAKQVFPLVLVKICYFRFSETIIRKMNSIGLKSVYDSGEEAREYLKSIISLAFVQPQDVKMVFNLYSREYPDSKAHIKFMKYFKDHFIGTDTELPTFPIGWWNHYMGVMRGEPTTSKSTKGFVFTKKVKEIVNQYHSMNKLEYLKMLTHI